MGNFSRDTFDKLKHYVGVRLQQGVPLVDADWNEQEDIRKYELRTFLKWFIGDGVPSGNDGFRIVPILGKAIITAKKAAIEIDLEGSTAAAQLGFGVANYRAERRVPPSAQLIGSSPGPFGDLVGKKLVIKTRDLSTEKWSIDTITFQAAVFKQAEVKEVVAAINGAASSHLTAAVGGENDFAIRGGDGTPDGAGRCLVEGWDVLNESDLRYTEQPLYNNSTLGRAWGVDPLPPLTTPKAARTGTVYLDVWEREVTSAGDPELKNPLIDVETCVRIKREWVVRVAEDSREAPKPLANHVFYPLATLKRPAGGAAIEQAQIADLRRTELALPYADVRQISADAFGREYALDLDGQPNLRVSLRTAINALLRGELPAMPELPLTRVASSDVSPVVLAVGEEVWMFWNRPTFESQWIFYIHYTPAHGWESEKWPATDLGHAQAPAAVAVGEEIWVFWHSLKKGDWDIWYNHYTPGGAWAGDKQLTTEIASDTKPTAVAVGEEIWVFWSSFRKGNWDIWYNHYTPGGAWAGDKALTTDVKSDQTPTAIAVGEETWVFWNSSRKGNWDIWYNRYTPNGGWAGDKELTITDVGEGQTPTAVAVGEEIWVFWNSLSEGNWHIWYNRYTPARGWRGESRLTTVGGQSQAPALAAVAVSKEVWVFWSSSREGNWHIWYNRYTPARGWRGDSRLTTDAGQNYNPTAVAVGNELWVFWNSSRSGTNVILCKALLRAI